MEFEGKVAFVTGAASGIGFGIAKAFAATGMKVMMADIEEGPLEKAVANLRAANGAAEGVICDVSNVEAVRAAADRTIESFGKIHVLVNNAGVGGGSGETGTIPLEDWKWAVDVNLMGVVYGCETFVPLMKEHGEGGYIVNTASVAGTIANAGMAPYTATKFAVVGYSESMNAELRPQGIGVAVLCPGWVDTRIVESDRNHPNAKDRDTIASERAGEIGAFLKDGMSPDTVGKWVLESMENNASHIFTHPNWKDTISLRAQGMLKAYEECTKSPLIQSDEGALSKLTLPGSQD
jgi:NAD(P)-dependent dehydrogenase (short-subunit alcohol dehydrogenase family)